MGYDFEFKKYEDGELVSASGFYLGVTYNLKEIFKAIGWECKFEGCTKRRNSCQS